MVILNNSTLGVSDSHFIENFSNSAGGAIYVDKSQGIYVKKSIFTDNHSKI